MPLQKSFSEQNPAPKRWYWPRSKSHFDAQKADCTVPTRPPLPVSATTKNKLQAFQFQDHGQTTKALNETTLGSKTTVAALKEVPAPGESKEPAEKKSPTMSTRFSTGAVTPMAKLEWQDLMGVQTTQEDLEKSSPSERLMWQTRDTMESSSVTPMVSHRSRKRARSSSPTSSPHAKQTTPAVNVKGLTEALKTPHTDPAWELWDRFSVPGVDRVSPTGLTNPLLQLMDTSSPHPQQDGLPPSAKKERSLLRAMSYESAWFKRRKLRHVPEETTDTLPEGCRPPSKSSMVTALLESVDVELNRSKSIEDARGSVSRSPSPLKKSPQRRRQRSSEAALHQDGQRGEANLDVEGDISDSTSNTVDKEDRNEKPSSDYGDDAFDDDTLLQLDVQVNVFDTDDNMLVQIPDPLPKPQDGPKQPRDSFDGDVCDMDDDLFDGTEDMFDKVESGHTTQLSRQQPPQPGPQAPGSSTKAQRSEDDDYGHIFSDDIDFDAMEQAATQSAFSSSSNPSQKPRTIQRYLVNNVIETTFTDSRDCERAEKRLIVSGERTNSIKTVHLRDDWFETQASVKSYVHIIGEFDHTGTCVVDRNHGLIVLHPDQLISSTTLADSFSCTRKAVLQDRVKATSDVSAPLVYGTMLHEIFQAALFANKWDSVFLGSVIDKTLKLHIEDLYLVQVSPNDARDHLLTKMAEIRSWAARFVSHFPRSDAVLHNDKVTMCVSKLLDVEEHVWSPMYGLKGNIDATVEVTMRDGKDSKTLTVPFEVKTGKRPSTEHRTQTMLYNLLLSDRYDIDIYYGILYYTETSDTWRIPALRHELGAIIMKRNELACYIRERTVNLPPMLKNKRLCNSCFAQSTCFVYHKLADDGDGASSDLGAKFDEAVKHLTPKHKDFFLKWEDLLTKEEKESQKHRRELWTMLSTEREKLGRCLAHVIIEEGSASEDHQGSRINQFSYVFVKETAAPGFSFLDSQLAASEPIVISDEQGHFALARGYVTAVQKHKLSVAVDRRLHNARIRQPGFDPVDNQVFASIMEVVPEGVRPDASQGKIEAAPIRYRLDKDEFSNGMATVRNNLVQIMLNGVPGSQDIRELVVDRRPPRFSMPSQLSQQYYVASGESLNMDQEMAIEKVMTAQDYALVLGMPGTGKTTTIAHIIRALFAQGKSVLLTSYTHSAVDNILLKLKGDKMPVLRLGPAARVHPEVQEFAILASNPMTSFDEIHRAWHETPIVATTCLSINHAIFAARRFDYCIVDEASQTTLPVCLGPIRTARTFVLVGDHNQLPPLVQNEQARAGGLDVSLFKLLSDTHPESVANLEHQYRMCEDIMTLSNTLIYNGRLKCGTEKLRFRSLNVPNMGALRQRHYDAATFQSQSQKVCLQQKCHRNGGSLTKVLLSSPPKRAGPPSTLCLGGARPGACWLRDLLEPSARARFVNTDALPDSREEAKGNRIVNACEARVVAQLADALLAVGVAPRDIGVMTHYRSQLALLKHTLHYRGGGGAAAADIEMHTADRFQGRDKEVVMLSLVRSNEACNIGDLLRDWRRINVAFTRAKTKLIVVGSRETLRGCDKGKAGNGNGNGQRRGKDRSNNDYGDDGDGSEMLARFIDLMEQRDWVYDLPPDALESHYFPEAEGPSQLTGGPAAAATSPFKRKAGRSPRKSQQEACKSGQLRAAKRPGPGDKENGRLKPKRAKVGEKLLMKGRPILRDVLNEMTNGRY